MLIEPKCAGKIPTAYKIPEHVQGYNQTKVCSLCLSDEHLIRGCPDFKCYNAERCQACNRFLKKCDCDEESAEDEIEDKGDQIGHDHDEMRWDERR